MATKIETIEKTIIEIRRDLETAREDLSEIKAAFREVKGGWRVILAGAALLGGALSWVTTYFLGKH